MSFEVVVVQPSRLNQHAFITILDFVVVVGVGDEREVIYFNSLAISGNTHMEPMSNLIREEWHIFQSSTSFTIFELFHKNLRKWKHSAYVTEDIPYVILNRKLSLDFTDYGD
ncbi:hypothetical protein HELRODRAFT_182449 [Helobdella robusta]|uniref:Uncharacterized protein n=1 Tax=Helobdella robusta TaxID=6412 RepID=T1FI76_HELRO|nr:hypothetical protein HELRODRAFT_182449 [Helobdella robusta]ESN90977.1 hypothetical protein HELRODRAFT_182449 [Helobdella robusta]